ncbi:hypothetical protein ACH4E7_21580 [Kitasatospora sp. NPDC018058]|uniref:hypothetical protein n=1 Tax=Kitasatospora sp. NPDC018058 TaxID=3364025 RepID=UPI0037BEF703
MTTALPDGWNNLPRRELPAIPIRTAVTCGNTGSSRSGGTARRRIRDQIEQRIRGLLADLAIEPAT